MTEYLAECSKANGSILILVTTVLKGMQSRITLNQLQEADYIRCHRVKTVNVRVATAMPKAEI